jgi:hypothetical protein
LVATGSSGSAASTALNVTDAPVSAAPAARPGASLVATVSSVCAGDQVTAWGAGFQPSEDVLVSLVAGANDSIILGGIVAGDTGSFAFDGPKTRRGAPAGLSDSIAAGLYTLEAIGALGSRTSAPLQVVTDKC